MRAIMMREPGEPAVLELVERDDPRPGPGQVVVSVTAAGVNFMDIGVRRGNISAERPNPKVLGVEGAGRVLLTGDGVERVRPGDRVAWVYAPESYAERVLVSADALVPVPDTIDDRTAAAVMMQGLTANHFASSFYEIREGDIALIHAAAGGVGLLLTQLVKLRGGKVIGRVSSADKLAIAKAAGADHVIIDTDGDFAEEVVRLSGGDGVHIVYDGSGPKTFAASLASLRSCGTFCWYGPVLGGPGPIEITSLPKSIKIGYGVFSDSLQTPEQLQAHSAYLFNLIAEGKLKVNIGAEYPLEQAAKAHSDMESRATTGKLLLIP